MSNNKLSHPGDEWDWTEQTLCGQLINYTRAGYIPMHMPGHKRNTDLFPYLKCLGGALDITEIDGFDDLNAPTGILADSERHAAKLWESSCTIYSVNGSTGALLASIRAALTIAGRGAHVLLPRSAHRAVFHALELCGAVPVYLATRVSPAGVPLSVKPEEVAGALEADRSISLVIVTSPTYEGIISDIRSISNVCTEHNAFLLVDEAHGAHLGLYGAFPDGAVRCGADLSVQSLHKTLPSLTQTALIQIGTRFAPYTEELHRQMQIFQTSSPSYLLTASIDSTVKYLEHSGEQLLKSWANHLSDARKRLGTLRCLRLMGASDSAVYDIDPAHITILTDRSGLSGPELCRKLREHGIEPEMASVNHAVMISGAGDTKDSLSEFTNALLEIDRECCSSCKGYSEQYGTMHIPLRVLTSSEAVRMPSCAVPLAHASGRVSAAYVYAYPPGVPITVPGEVIDSDTADRISLLMNTGCRICGLTEDGLLRVICDENI